MRVRRVGIVLASALALSVPAGIQIAAPAQAASCGTLQAPGFHAFSTRTTNYSCRRAKRTVVAWFKNNARPSSGPRGWRCRKKPSGRWRCTRRSAVITFIFHKY
jgi:hypothetical protein